MVANIEMIYIVPVIDHSRHWVCTVFIEIMICTILQTSSCANMYWKKSEWIHTEGQHQKTNEIIRKGRAQEPIGWSLIKQVLKVQNVVFTTAKCWKVVPCTCQ